MKNLITVNEVIKKLESFGNPENIAGMARFGITAKKAFGISAPILKSLARDIKKQTENRHELALELWETGIYEARFVACLIDEPEKVTAGQMDDWAADFDNWATCDAACGHLFCRTEFAYEKAFLWASREEEFVKRAGIVLAAWLAVHDKKASDEQIARFLPLLENVSDDARNYVKKAVSWSLRQIGKRNLNLNRRALETAAKIKTRGTKAARWIASDAQRELTNEKTLARVGQKSKG